jgi:hypothetical protein
MSTATPGTLSRSSVIVAVPLLWLRHTIVSLAPWRASSSVAAFPIPDVAPVITTHASRTVPRMVFLAFQSFALVCSSVTTRVDVLGGSARDVQSVDPSTGQIDDV